MQLNSKLRGLAWLLFLLYIAVLLKVILFKHPPVGPMLENMTLDQLQFRLQHAANFTPFVTIAFYFSGHANLPVAVNNIGGNIVLFGPLGFLVPILLPKIRRVRQITTAAFGVSLSLELIQLLTGLGGFDVDDLLLNVLGGIIGWLAFKVVCRLLTTTSFGMTAHVGGPET